MLLDAIRSVLRKNHATGETVGGPLDIPAGY
jgi:hypothetical protein